MTKLLDQAIEAVRGLPAAVQDDLASVLLRLAGKADEAAVRLTPEDRLALEDADGEIARGEFATEAEMHELWTKRIISSSRVVPGGRSKGSSTESPRIRLRAPLA